MKNKIIKALLISIISIGVIYLIILSIYDSKRISTETDITGRGKNNEEYIYKEDLLNLGYNIDEIDKIENKINNSDVSKYLLNKKYNNITSFISSPYFNISNIDRYQTYFNKQKFNEDDTVMYVEIGLDQNFYTNEIPSNINDKELILVNKYNYLEENYDANLVTMDDNYVKSGSKKMNAVAYEHFKEMCDAASQEQITLKSVSAYRSYSSQKSLYDNYVKKDGIEKADTYSARAGYSEHQTGLAVDINTASSSKHFENTKEYNWLINNSYKYGFILRYPENKTFITGYKYEPWHFRYVGIDAATKIYTQNITFEEYRIKFYKK